MLRILWVLLPIFSTCVAVRGATNELIQDRPVMVIAVPQNSVVNVTFEQRPVDSQPQILPNTTVIPIISNTTQEAWATPNTTLFSFATPNVTFAPVVVSFTGFENATTTTTTNQPMNRVPGSSVPGFVDAFMLPLGSEGPNANRDGPINAQLPPGTVLDQAVLSAIPQVDPSKVLLSRNRRIEIKFTDFQMVHTDTSTGKINQPVAISVKYIVGTPPPIIAPNEETMLIPDVVATTDPLSTPNNSTGLLPAVVHHNMTLRPENLSGFLQIYNGSYDSTANDNKISIQKILTAELCGRSTDYQQGYIEVSIKPTVTVPVNESASEGYYKCFLMVSYAPAARESESLWSPINDCDSSANPNHFKYHLGFRTRQYYIDTAACQRDRPMLSEHN